MCTSKNAGASVAPGNYDMFSCRQLVRQSRANRLNPSIVERDKRLLDPPCPIPELLCRQHRAHKKRLYRKRSVNNQLHLRNLVACLRGTKRSLRSL